MRLSAVMSLGHNPQKQPNCSEWPLPSLTLFADGQAFSSKRNVSCLFDLWISESSYRLLVSPPALSDVEVADDARLSLHTI